MHQETITAAASVAQCNTLPLSERGGSVERHRLSDILSFPKLRRAFPAIGYGSRLDSTPDTTAPRPFSLYST